MKKPLLLAGVLLGALFARSNAQVIDTTLGSPMFEIGSVGEPGTTTSLATFGNSFVAPSGFLKLDSFTFWLRSASGPDGMEFAAYIQEWNEAPLDWRTVGPVLYESAPQVVSFPTATLTPFTFNTGGLVLDSSKRYIAFISASNFYDGSVGTAMIGLVNVSAFSLAHPFLAFNGDDFSLLSTDSWDLFGNAPLAFRATFSAAPITAVPEPATYGLAGAIVLFGFVAFRRCVNRNRPLRRDSFRL